MKKILILTILSSFLFLSCNTNKSKNNNSGKESKNTVIYWINSSLVNCQGEVEMKCMQVQKSEVIDPKKWEFFYNSIEGFSYEEGYIYQIKVKEEKLEEKDIPADGSSKKYSLIEVLSKTKVETPTKIAGIWYITNVNGKNVSEFKTQKTPQITFDVVNMKYSGNDGCNNIFGEIEKLTDSKIKFDKLASTMMLCENMEISDEISKNHQLITGYSIKNNSLLFVNDKNEILITLSREK